MTIAAAAPRGHPGGLQAERVLGWARRNLFSSPVNTLLTVLVVGFLWLVVPPIVEWGIFGATLSGSSKAACTGDGACWTFIRLRLPLFLWGHYPIEQLWRVGAALLLHSPVNASRRSSRIVAHNPGSMWFVTPSP